ncbi:MAG: hypothetical protein QM704_02615 [Anaeromyxobacteraceae bacterium]
MRFVLLLALLSVPAVSHAQEASDPAAGAIVTDEGATELLGRVYRKGDVIQLPEGTLTIEEDAHPGEEQGVGSFTVITPTVVTPGEGPVAAAPVEARPVDDGAWASSTGRGAAPPCEAERSAFIAELWRGWGVEVEDPAAFLEGLAGGDPGLVLSWLASAEQTIRPIAWSSGLRARADALAACARQR